MLRADPRATAAAMRHAPRGPPCSWTWTGACSAPISSGRAWARLVVTRPGRLPGLLPALLSGKVGFKAYVAKHAAPSIDTLPLHEEVVRLIAEAQAAGRPVLLVSGAHGDQVRALSNRLGAYGTVCRDGPVNLVGRAKLVAVQRQFAIGNALVDLPLWRAAQRPYLVNAAPWTRWLARRSRADLVDLG